LVVLALLRMRWSLSGREGFGFLSRRDSTLFGEVKCLCSTSPEVRKETEANGGHCGDRTQSWFDRTRPVSSQQLSGARVLGFPTGASGPSWNRTIRSGTQRGTVGRRADRTRGASGHVRSDATGHGGSLLDSDWTPGAARPVKRWSAFGHGNGNF
jgi:hypothetical protein